MANWKAEIFSKRRIIKMFKYISLFGHFIRNNLVRELEFRGNFIIRLITQILGVTLQVIMTNIYFQYTNSIHGWTKGEVFLLIGIFRLIEGAFHMFVHSNLLNLPESIDQGELDFNLIKPIDSLYLSSFRRHQLYEITTVLSGFAIILYISPKLAGFTFLSWASIFIVSIMGFVALYSIVALFSTLAIFTTRLTALSSVWDLISKTSRFPLNALTLDNHLGSLILAPLFLVVTIPSQIVLNKLSWPYLILELAGCFVLLIAAKTFWSFALRHYSSASS